MYAYFFSRASTLVEAVHEAMGLMDLSLSNSVRTQTDTTSLTSGQDHGPDVQEVLASLKITDDNTLAKTLLAFAADPPRQGAEGFGKSESFTLHTRRHWHFGTTPSLARIVLYARRFSRAATFIGALRECLERFPLQ